ncbi:MAG: DUF4416 family protein [Candidatus Aminicenantes bacterium]|nr:DUF4416 family protein [Candidatus Aminicenantes bacterium]
MKPTQFSPVKLIFGIIASDNRVFKRGESRLKKLFGPLDAESQKWPFTFTDYYQKEMGKDLFRKFLSFEKLIKPERLAEIKLTSNDMEGKISHEFKSKSRIINLDPGYLTTAALFMATTKNFASRVPLQKGIYAHLELMFGKNEVRFLDWTYPDFRNTGYQEFFLKIRAIYLEQLCCF